MLFPQETKESLNSFFQTIRLQGLNNESGKDKEAKIEQILAYLEILNARIKNFSRRRELVLIDCGAGNCYLSLLIYYYFNKIEGRKIKIYCLDINERLMEKNRLLAEKLGFDQMYFIATDIQDYSFEGRPDIVYSLHACDTATDMALYLGCKTNARNIFSVSCCQHFIKKQMRSGSFTGLTQHRVFKDKLVYMLGDSLRALLLKMQGYDVNVIDFITSRYTDKNVMIRAQKAQINKLEKTMDEYRTLQEMFGIRPQLERYLYPDGMLFASKMREVA